MTTQIPQPAPPTQQQTVKDTTKLLLQRDRERATDILLQLRYELSRKVSSIEVK